MPIQAIVFDMDGTLTDTNPSSIHTVKTAIEQLSGKKLTTEQLVKHFGPTCLDVIAEVSGVPTTEAFTRQYLSLVRNHVLDTVQPIPGVYEMLLALRKLRIPLGVYSARAQAATQTVLSAMGLSDFFTVCFGGDSAPKGKTKPNPDGLWLAVDELHATTQSALYVGDSLSDLRTAKAATVRSVLATWAPDGKPELSKYADLVFDSPKKLATWVQEVFTD